MDQSREANKGASPPTPSGPSGSPSAPASTTKQALRGKPFAEQEAMLAPKDESAAAMKDGENTGARPPGDTTPLALDVCTLQGSAVGDITDRRTVGVGEEVDITPTVSGGRFTCVGGRGTASPTDPSVWRWSAPGVARQCRVTYQLGDEVKSLMFEVLAPDGMQALGHEPQAFDAGTQGVGMYVPLQVTPTNVSFAAILSRETKVPGRGTGYFANKPASALAHNPADEAPIYGDNRGVKDHASFYGWGDPSSWAAGTWDWEIPTQWSMQDGSTGWKTYKTFRQHMTLAADGTSTVTKYHETESRKP